MYNLFQFQKDTLEEIAKTLSDFDLVVLTGEKDSGKSVLVHEFSKAKYVDYPITLFSAEPSHKFNDFNCVPEDIKNTFYSAKRRNKYGKNIIKDAMITATKLTPVNINNILESVLSVDENDEIKEFISFLHKANRKQLFIFDNLDFFDNRSLLFLNKLIALSLDPECNFMKILVVIDTSANNKIDYIDSMFFSEMKKVKIKCPTDSDLKPYVISSLYNVARYIPIKYILQLTPNCSEIDNYYIDKINTLSKSNQYIKEIMLLLSVLDSFMLSSDLISLSGIPDDEFLQGINVLVKNLLVEKQIIDNKTYFNISDFIRDNMRKFIPDYIALHKYEIFLRQLEYTQPFNYLLRYKLYQKIGHYENACGNAILAYCSIARQDTDEFAGELLTLTNFLETSSYRDFFCTLKKAYNSYNRNEYKDCYDTINKFLTRIGIPDGKDFVILAYVPEFVLELIFLKEICVGRIFEYNQNIIKNELSLIEFAINHAKIIENEELELRLSEKRLLLESYITAQLPKQQRTLSSRYFELCNRYKLHMRKSNTITFKYWEIRYASLLLKINIISNVPNKVLALERSYFLFKRNKDEHYKNYLRAACNYACDLMWRNEYDTSFKILNEAVQFVKAAHKEEYWGVIFQMYIFAGLYKSSPVKASQLLSQYHKSVWKQEEIKIRMHEPFICDSNYSILLAAAGYKKEALQFLRKSFAQCKKKSSSVYDKYLIQTNLAGLEYLCGNSRKAYLLEQECTEMIKQRQVPVFSYPFLCKRNSTMLNIYQNEKTVESIVKPLITRQKLSTGYCSDNYLRLLLFSDINYWAD